MKKLGKVLLTTALALGFASQAAAIQNGETYTVSATMCGVSSSNCTVTTNTIMLIWNGASYDHVLISTVTRLIPNPYRTLVQ